MKRTDLTQGTSATLTAASAAACLTPVAGVASSSHVASPSGVDQNVVTPRLSWPHHRVACALRWSRPSHLCRRPLLHEACWPRCSYLCTWYRGPSALACFECIKVGVGDSILAAFETGSPLARPSLRLVPPLDAGAALFVKGT